MTLLKGNYLRQWFFTFINARESAVVLKTKTNEEINLPVGHVHDLLDGFLGLVVISQECQFAGEFRIDGLIDKSEKCLRLERHIHIAVSYGRKVGEKMLINLPVDVVHLTFYKKSKDNVLFPFRD